MASRTSTSNAARVAGPGRIYFCKQKIATDCTDQEQVRKQSKLFQACLAIDLRFCFTYTRLNEAALEIQFWSRNYATGIISIYSSFSANHTSHSQLGHESIALAFLHSFS